MNKTALKAIVGLVLFSLVSFGLLLTYKIWRGEGSLSKMAIPGRGGGPGLTRPPLRPTVPPTLSPAKSGTIFLTISSPADKSTVSSSKVIVQGKTAARAEVFVNEKETVADGQGNFSVSLTLEEGENSIYVAATGEEGNIAEKEIIVTYIPPES